MRKKQLMMNSKMKLVFFCSVTLGMSAFSAIETVRLPSDEQDRGRIYRATIFRVGEVVKFGQCDTLEPQCGPEADLLTIKREMPYLEYQRRLAERFNVPASYLIEHEKSIQNYQGYIASLSQIIDSQSVSDLEKNNAKKSFNLMTQKKGVLSRFLQALAIKRHLEWEESDAEGEEVLAKSFERGQALAQTIRTSLNAEGDAQENKDEAFGAFQDEIDVTYEKSLSQYAGALWPINFAKELTTDNPLERFEPSTDLVWQLAASDVNRQEALGACGEGFRPATFEEIVAASIWLKETALADKMSFSKLREKRVWLASGTSQRGKKIGSEMKDVEVGYRTTQRKSVDVYQYDVLFDYVDLLNPQIRKSVTLNTTATNPIEGQWYDYAAEYGKFSSAASVLCVAPYRPED